MTAARSMTIGALARDAGVTIETVRYYQRRKLLGVPARPTGGVRRYGEDALARIRFIKRAQDLGFTLDEVGEQHKLRAARAPKAAVRALAEHHLDDLETRIADLSRMRDALKHLTHACAHGHDPHCPILESLAAGVGTNDGIGS